MSSTEMVRLAGNATHVVRERDCATQWGNEGLTVLSTPSILGLMEQTCVETLAATLEPGQMTVGAAVTMSHEAPSKLGEAVTYGVEIERRGKSIDVVFTVSNADGTVVSRGTHKRAVIDRARFLARLG
ncbi:thioesterase family protein [Actinokineospora sp. 24-640]